MIDLKKLEAACKGDGDDKLTVRRAWLKEVLKEMRALEALRREKAEHEESVRKYDSEISDLDSKDKNVNAIFERLFGKVGSNHWGRRRP